MAVVRSEGLAAGEQVFEKLLSDSRKRHGSNSVETADLLMAFGVGLFVESKDNDDPAAGDASLRYLKAAIPAYQAAFGANHAEVAVALTSYADAEMELQGGAPSAEAEAARERAYNVRLRALGRGHPETRASLRSLAGVKGHPSRVKGDADRLNAAVGSLENLLIDAPDHPFDVAPWFIRLKMARIYALNGKGTEALEQAKMARVEANRRGDFTACVVFSAEVGEVAEILRKSGNGAVADTIEPPNALAEILRCASEEESNAQTVASN